MSLLDLIKAPAARVPRPVDPTGEIIDLPDPDEVVIPLEYPGQILFQPLVKEGDEVARKQVIGRSKRGNCIHASVSGRVKEIRTIWSANSYHVPAIFIERSDAPALNSGQIMAQCNLGRASATRLDLLRAGGVISPWTTPGPDHQEESIASNPEIRHIVVKGLNEEPTNSNFELLLREQAENVRNWISRLQEVVPTATVYLLVRRSLESWAKDLLGDSSIQIIGLKDDYRSRLERVIVPKVTGISLPNTAPYGKYGVAVLSMEHCQTAFNALDGEPFIRKTVTLAGEGLKTPVTLRAPLGTMVSALLASQGLETPPGGRVIMGGPMKGMAQYADTTPLSKFVHGIYLLSKEQLPSEVNLTCINCGRCTDACPSHLQVHLIGRYVEFDQLAEARTYHPEACHQCGLCAFVCPSHRPLVQLVKIAKKYGE
jgi:Na+-translocating ferredoxin:NAD+ oxidoreductase subunit C